MLILFVLLMQALMLFLALVLSMYMLYILATMHKIVPYVPTPYWIIRKMIELAQLKGHENIIDPGSGSGRIILEVARHHKGSVTGIEYSPLLVHVSRFRSRLRRKQCPVNIIWGDFAKVDFHPYDVVFCFLTSKAFKQLANQFDAMKEGSRLVSYMFQPILSDQWQQEIVRVGRKEREKIFVCKKI